jgi:hypothetical protein
MTGRSRLLARDWTTALFPTPGAPHTNAGLPISTSVRRVWLTRLDRMQSVLSICDAPVVELAVEFSARKCAEIKQQRPTAAIARFFQTVFSPPSRRDWNVPASVTNASLMK